jgi:hypothetical protein
VATRTVRQCTAECPRKYGGPSGLGRGLSVKANRTSSSEPRKTDRPRGARGLSARHPRTVRPLLRTVRNNYQPKLKTKMDQKRTRARTRRTRRRTGTARTVRLVLADRPRGAERAENTRPRKSTPPNHHRISQTVEAVETGVWGLEKPKNLAS